MTIRLTTNPYQGINAHFNSFLQSSEGGWTTFHGDHIAHLKTAVNRNLPDGYYAVAEKSFQIFLPDTEPQRTRPDVGVFQARATQAPGLQSSGIATPTYEVPLERVDYDLLAVEIFHENAPRFITRLELLSPTNKLARHSYLQMHQKMLNLGVHMVTIDYLHETPPVFAEVLANYTQDEESAYPYNIAVADAAGEVIQFYCFRVEDSLPVLRIPLRGDDSFILNFGEVYNYTFEDDRRAHMLIDYAQEPPNFSAYSPADQERIRAVMARLS